MARFAILTLSEAGHLFPLGAVGIELVRRGHEVTVVLRGRAAPLVEQLQLGYYKLEVEDIAWPSNFLCWLAFSLVGAGWYINLREFFAWNAEGVLRLVPSILKELAVDGVVVDQAIVGGGTAAERAGLPFVTVCTAPPWNEDPALPPVFTSWPYEDSGRARLRNRLGYAGWRWFMRPTLRVLNRYRKTWGLRRFRDMDESYSSLAQISQLFPQLDFPRSALPACFHYVGALTADRHDTTEGFPWHRLDGRPLIYASLGTIADRKDRRVYAKIAAACQGLPAQLVLARGRWDEEDAGQQATYDLPGDPLVVDFAPQLPLLDRAAVLITHAGLNTTLEAISRGVPMVALPRSADQPGNAARIAHSGAGLCAPFHRGTPEELRRVIQRVLSEETFCKRARELQQAMRAAGGARRAGEITEQALLTRQPVTRGQNARRPEALCFSPTESAHVNYPGRNLSK
jgi:zeaxanthin glucosyltransferase